MDECLIKCGAFNSQKQTCQILLVRELSIQVDCENTASVILSMIHMHVAVAVVKVGEIQLVEFENVDGDFKGGKNRLQVGAGSLLVTFPGY